MFALISGSANLPLARQVADALGEELRPVEHARYPDGEAAVAVDPSVRAEDVYLIQPVTPPTDPHLIELALLADACRRADCARLTVVAPYLAYSRQDRRPKPGAAVGAGVVARVLEAVGVDRVLVMDPHTAQLEAMYGMPLDSLSAVDLLADGLAEDLDADAVVVAPDMGAAKRADRYAARLDLPTAVISKTRIDGRHVEVNHVIGEVRDRVPIIVDDMISTGGTIEAAVEALREAGCAEGTRVAATHGLFVEDAAGLMSRLEPRSVDVTDTIPQVDSPPYPRRTRSVAPLLAAAIARLVAEQPLGELAAHG